MSKKTNNVQVLLECIVDAESAQSVCDWLSKPRNEAGSLGNDAVLIWFSEATSKGQDLPGPVLILPCFIKSIDTEPIDDARCRSVVEIHTDGVEPLRLSMSHAVDGLPNWVARSTKGAFTRGFVFPTTPPGTPQEWQASQLGPLTDALRSELLKHDAVRDIVANRQAARRKAAKAIPGIFAPTINVVADSTTAAQDLSTRFADRFDTKKHIPDGGGVAQTRVVCYLHGSKRQVEYLIGDPGQDPIAVAREALQQHLDPSTLQFVLGLECLADNDGAFTIQPTTLAKLFGVDPDTIDRRDRKGGKLSLRQTWATKLQELGRIRFEFELGNNTTARMPLFVATADLVDTDTRSVLASRWRFNPELWTQYKKRGWVAAVDIGVCQLHAQNDGWAIKLAAWLSSWLSKSHTTRHLDKAGRTVPIGMTKLLDNAGINYKPQLHKNGKPWLRKRVFEQLNNLRNMAHGPMFLFEHTTTADGEDLLRFAWGEHLQAVQTAASSKRINKRNKHTTNKTGPTPSTR